MALRKYFFFALRLMGYALALLAVLIFVANVWIIKSTENKIVSAINLSGNKNIVLVLGTSSKLTNGTANPFFENRIKTASYLYRQGKVAHFILSGDNRSVYYNEPFEMRKALMKAGVPDSVITLDYAGLRTLDSIVRSKVIFGQNKITIITQPFHCYRALFISTYFGLDAVAIAAKEPSLENAPKVYFREYFARAKAILDLYILKTTPRHMGNRQSIGGDQ
jgi:SanA protein